MVRDDVCNGFLHDDTGVSNLARIKKSVRQKLSPQPSFTWPDGNAILKETANEKTFELKTRLQRSCESYLLTESALLFLTLVTRLVWSLLDMPCLILG